MTHSKLAEAYDELDVQPNEARVWRTLGLGRPTSRRDSTFPRDTSEAAGRWRPGRGSPTPSIR